MILRGRRGAVLGAAIVAAAAFSAIGLHLRLSRIGPARERLDILAEEIGRERQVAGRRPFLEDEKARLDARAAEFREKLPPPDESGLDAVRRELTEDAAKAGVLVTALRPTPAADGTVEEVVFAVEAQGDWASLGRFLDLIETQKRAVIVDQFELKPGEAGDRPVPAPATLSLRLTAFRVEEQR